jgi:hypothetical protein
MAEQYEYTNLIQPYNDDAFTLALESLMPRGLAWIFGKTTIDDIIQDSVSAEWLNDSITSLNELTDVASSSSASTGAFITLFLSCFASELKRICDKAVYIYNQNDPGVSVEFLEDWERNLNLSRGSLTLEERQVVAHQLLYAPYQVLTKQFYIDYASALGWEISLEENLLDEDLALTGEALTGEAICSFGPEILSYLIITVEGPGNYGDDFTLLVSEFEKLKQAHVVITWIDGR